MFRIPTMSNADKNRIVDENRQYKQQLRKQEEKNTLNCIEELKRQIEQVPASERERQYKEYLLNPRNNDPFVVSIQWNEIMQKCNIHNINNKLYPNQMHISWRGDNTKDIIFIDRYGEPLEYYDRDN